MACAACGGAGGDAGRGPNAPNGGADDGFAEYVAKRGIATLEGAGGETPEVTSDGLRLERIEKDKPVKLDGVLNEWPAPAKTTVAAKGETKSSMKVSLQYDDAKLYVGADVSDASFVAARDHAQLVLAVPRAGGGGYAVYAVDFFPGKPGESEGSVRYGRGSAVAGAKIVEASTGSGSYSFEAIVPWTSLPEAHATRVGIHGVARYVDGDGAGSAIVATGPGDARSPESMPWVPSEPEIALVESVLAPKGLTKIAPSIAIVADLTGDGMRERIAVFEHYLTICGANYLGGTGYFFRDLVGEPVSVEARDATGRGRADVVVRRRQNVGDATREYLEVLSAPNATDEPRLVFAHEIRVQQSDRHIDNAVRVGRGEIEVSAEPASHWDALSYREPIASDVEPIVFPWGAVKSQVYKFDGSKFTKQGEVAQKASMPAAGGTPERPAPVHPPEPPTPKVARGGDLSTQVFEQYKRDRGVPADAQPKVDLQVHVAGDKRAERVVLLGRDVVVFGPGFKGGSGYAFITLSQFASADDIKDLSARDLTGDGAADVVVRGVRHVPADGPSGVEVETMFVYEVKSDSVARIFGIETAREQNGKRVQGLVQFIPASGGRSFDVLATPGRATGWSDKTYPWAQEQPGSGSVEPLLLPWGGISNVRYSYNGATYARQ